MSHVGFFSFGGFAVALSGREAGRLSGPLGMRRHPRQVRCLAADEEVGNPFVSSLWTAGPIRGSVGLGRGRRFPPFSAFPFHPRAPIASPDLCRAPSIRAGISRRRARRWPRPSFRCGIRRPGCRAWRSASGSRASWGCLPRDGVVPPPCRARRSVHAPLIWHVLSGRWLEARGARACRDGSPPVRRSGIGRIACQRGLAGVDRRLSRRRGSPSRRTPRSASALRRASVRCGSSSSTVPPGHDRVSRRPHPSEVPPELLADLGPPEARGRGATRLDLAAHLVDGCLATQAG